MMVKGSPLSGKRILIVEDNFLVAEDLQQMIRDAGGDVRKASASATDALQALSNQSFDGAVLDVQLRDGTFIEVARQLERQRIPYVVVTGYSRDWLPLELQKAPYIAKPFNRKELINLGIRHFAPGREPLA
jgi:CheY-like chemotaxis protein